MLRRESPKGIHTMAGAIAPGYGLVPLQGTTPRAWTFGCAFIRDVFPQLARGREFRDARTVLSLNPDVIWFWRTP
jgi:hypothetical protein